MVAEAGGGGDPPPPPPPPPTNELPIIDDTRNAEFLDEAALEPRASGAAFPQGDAIDLWNGNLRLTHTSSPSYALDGRLSLGLVRGYNSKKARKDKFVFGTLLRQTVMGRSWVGLGWTSHFGRIFKMPVYRGDRDYGERSYFETPSGGLFKFKPNLNKAHPGLDIQYVADAECTNWGLPPWCSKFPDSPDCNEDICLDWNEKPGYYNVTYPDGTVVKLDHYVAAETLDPGGWIENYDLAGWYATEIADVFGNKIHIVYSADPAAVPGAIEKVWAGTDENDPDAELTMTLWSQADVDAGDCPAAAKGHLRSVHGTGFEGQEVVYEFHYGTKTLVDQQRGELREAGQQKVLDVAILTRVDVGEPGAAPAFTTRYSYGVSPSVGSSSTPFKALLGRVTYPMGAVIEYEHGANVLGTRPDGSGGLEEREVTGVVRRVEFPDGLGDSGSPADQPHYTWRWERQFATTQCNLSDKNASQITNDFVTTLPDGREIRTKFYGHPCGENDQEWGSFGTVWKSETRDGAGPYGALLRTVELTFDTEQDSNSHEVGKAMRQLTTTTFEDDTGQCFGGAGGGTARKMITEYRHRNSLNHWKMSIVRGDYLRDHLLTYTDYEESGPRVAKHILGAWDYSFVESGSGSAESRYEQRAQFDDNGNVTNLWAKNEWKTASTQLAENPADDIVHPPAEDWSADTDNLHTGFTYYGNGNTNTSTLDGADPSPADGATPAYTTTLTWQKGVTKKVEQSGLGYPVSEVVLDDSGLVKEALDPNGPKMVFSYDALGRVTRVDPEDPPGASEQATRLYYPDLSDPNAALLSKVITSSGEESDFQPGTQDQLYAEQTTDGLGRVIEARRALPDGTKSVQVVRYDQLGRVIFSSVWMSESDYSAATKTSWEAPDRDGDGVAEYRVSGVPLTPGDAEGRPWGVIAFYGTPTGTDLYNPLAIDPDGLGRVHRTIAADGTTVDLDYCGPHTQKSVQVREDVTSNQTQPAVTRYYRDGLGRVVLVDTPDSTAAGGQAADAIYEYGLRGKLREAKIVDDLGDDPYGKWLDGTLNPAVVQKRTFDYDAAGRLQSYETPEEGQAQVMSYNAAGQPWRWQDALGAERGYAFEAKYDDAGRQTEIQKVKLPDGSSSSSLEEGFEFAAGTYGGWTPGTIDATGVFHQESSSSWQVVSYADLGCIDPPPGSGNSNGLYLGDGCSYDSVPAGTQAVRRKMTGVDRDTVLTFTFWRQVREGSGDHDAFEVLLASPGDDQLANAPRVLRLDEKQRSYAHWRKTITVRPGDLIDDDDAWPRDLDVIFAFTKGDGQSGVGTGVFVDDVFAGKRDEEALVQYAFDENLCAGGTVDEACTDAVMSSDQSKGKLTTVRSFHDGKVFAITRYVYRGLNGRLSMTEQWIDWTMTANPQDPAGWARWITRYRYTDQGQLASVTGPYLAGEAAPRTYEYSYLRGQLDGIEETSEGVQFVEPGGTNALYGPWGNLEFLRFASGASSTFSTDALGRISGIEVKGPDNSSYWNSGAYRFDGAGNIVGIGDQEYSYFPSGSLHEAKVRPQAGDPDGVLQTLTFGYDPFGNMTSRQLDPADPKPDVPGLEFSGRSYDDGNHVTDTGFRYDAMGRTIRYPRQVDTAGSDPLVQAAMWSDGGQLMSFFQGEPKTGEAPSEQYLYDAGGLRLVRLALGRDGKARISVRDVSGQAAAEYVDEPGSEGMSLERELVYGFGRLLVERHPSAPTPDHAASSSLYSSGSYSLDLTDSGGGTSFDVDIQTESGFRNQVPNIQPDGSGRYQIAESDLSPGETNYLRIKAVSPEESPYSMPVSISYDPSIDGSSENQVRSVSVSRVGDNLLVRWSLHQDNGKAFRIYFHRADNGLTYVLSATALPSGTTEYTIASQALAAPCGGIFLRQGEMGTGGSLTNPTDPSPEAGLPGPFYGELEPGAGGCLGGSEPPAPRRLVDRYHFRDHLGSLRIETGEAGWLDLGFDYYPFGLQMESDYAESFDESRRKYTGHERDSETGQDYMMARYKGIQLADFMTPDPLIVAGGRHSTGWNRYAYVGNSPLIYIDPYGLRADSIGNPEKKTLLYDTKDGVTYGAGGGSGGFPMPHWLAKVLASPITHVFSFALGWAEYRNEYGSGGNGGFVASGWSANEVRPRWSDGGSVGYWIAPGWGDKFISGYYWGTSYGQDALDYYADILVDPSSTWYQRTGAGVGGFFAALWTPTTYWKTYGVFVLGAGASEWASAARGGVRTAARNLAEKLALDEAKGGAGERIMQGMIKDPRFPENVWAKMQHVHQNPGGTKTVIHYWENLLTHAREGFKFK